MNLTAKFYGNLPYLDALSIQEKYHKRVKENPELIFILGFEHPACVTLGKHSTSKNILNTETQIAIYHTERGGEATAHEPGQLVIYPIMHLAKNHLGPKLYIQKIEKCILQTLEEYHLKANTIPEYPGVWIAQQRKIAAVGIRIKDKVSMHGTAINISNDLKTFSQIIPCGIRDKSVTTLNLEISQNIALEEVWKKFTGHFSNILKNEQRLPS